MSRRLPLSSITLFFLVAGCPAEPSDAPAKPTATKPAPSVPPDAPASAPASGPASAPSKEAPPPNLDNPTNVSGITAKGDCDGTKPCTCAGTMTYGHSALEKIGVTAVQLAEGTPCVFGDYDGNGYLDIAFLGQEYGEVVADKPSKTKVVVLSFDGLGLRAVPALAGVFGSLAVEKKIPVGDLLVDGLYDPSADPSVLYVLAGERFGVRKRTP